MPRSDDLLDDVAGDERAEGVENRLAPGVHLLGLAARQVAEVLAADGVQRPEHHDLAVLPPLEHRLEPGAQRERRLAGAGAAAERDDADVGVEQEVEGDPLLGAAAVQAEGVAVAAHQPDLLVRRDPAERAAALGHQDEPGVAGQVAAPPRGRRRSASYSWSRTSPADARARPCRSSRTRPPARRGTPRRCSPTAEALTRIGRSLLTSVTSWPSAGEVARDGEDPACRCRPRGRKPGRQHGRVGVVELDPQRAARARRPAPARRAGRARPAGRRAAAAPGARSSPARDARAWPPAR